MNEYKVGDKVQISTMLHKYIPYPCGINEIMINYAGQHALITDIDVKGHLFEGKEYDIYRLNIDAGEWSWSSPMFEGNNSIHEKYYLVDLLFKNKLRWIDEKIDDTFLTSMLISTILDKGHKNINKNDLRYINEMVSKLINILGTDASKINNNFVTSKLQGITNIKDWIWAYKRLLKILNY